jgi:hypothetical protein
MSVKSPFGARSLSRVARWNLVLVPAGLLAWLGAGACIPDLSDLTSGTGVGEGGTGDDATTPRPDVAAGDTGGGQDSGSPPADAPPDVAPAETGCGADVMNDSSNCGTCGHDCLGGACTIGQCQPIVLATTTGAIGIALDNTYVYYANTQSGSAGIYKITKALRGPGTPSLVSSASNVQGLAADGTYVYWTNKLSSGSVQRALPTGGGLTTLVNGQSQPDWIAVTVNGANVVWTNQGNNTVMTTPVGAVAGTTTPTQLNTVNEVGTLPAGIALDTTTVYYATKTSGGGEAESVSLDGGAVSPLGAATYVGITVDNDNVYWTGGFANPIVSQNYKGGNPSSVQIIASGGTLTCPLHLVSDGNNVFFFDQGTTVGDGGGVIVPEAGALYRVPVGNSGPLPPPLLKGLTDPQAIAQDATAIYWVQGGVSGAVMKLAK